MTALSLLPHLVYSGELEWLSNSFVQEEYERNLHLNVIVIIASENDITKVSSSDCIESLYGISH